MTRDSSIRAWHYLVYWFNPHTQPPEGQPRILARMTVPPAPGGSCPPIPDEIERIWREANAAFVATLPEGGPARWPWAIAVDPETPPPRQLSDDAKFRVRRKRLVRRIQQKYPLFAVEFVRKALMRKPEYYGLTPEEAASWTWESS